MIAKKWISALGWSICGIFVIAIGVSAGLSNCATTRIDVDRAEWMPEGATNGCMHHGGGIAILGPPAYYYEYDISEADFRKKFSGYEFQEVQGVKRVPRYLRDFVRMSEYDFNNGDESEAYDKIVNATIRNGLYYSHQEEDRSKDIGYDRARHRAYIFYTTR